MISAIELKKMPTNEKIAKDLETLHTPTIEEWLNRIVKKELKAIENTIIEAHKNGDTLVTVQTIGPSKAKLNQYIFTHIVKTLLQKGFKVSNFRKHPSSFYIGDRLYDISWGV